MLLSDKLKRNKIDPMFAELSKGHINEEANKDTVVVTG